MTRREMMAARIVAAVVAGNGDARRMSNVLRNEFNAKERNELYGLAREALRGLDAP